MRRIYLILIVLILIHFSGCKNYYNDTIHWADDIKQGTDIQTVKRNQPDFCFVAWDRPDTVDNQIHYEIKIKGNNDLLKMHHFLVFKNNTFEGRYSIK